MAAQIYARMEKGVDGQISEDEFIKVWTNSEKNILDQIARNKAEISKAIDQKRDIEMRLRELTAQEKQAGGFRNSKLSVNIMDGQSIPYDLSTVVCNFGTQPQVSSQGQGEFPIFNSNFVFEGVESTDVIELQVCPIEGESDEQPAYYAFLKVEQLTDQKIHELWLPLTVKGKRTPAKLHITTHYIYSHAMIGNEAIRKWDETIADYDARNMHLEQELRDLYRPFDHISNVGSNANPLRIGAVDNNTIENVMEPKFIAVPTRPIHLVYWAAFLVGAILLFVSLASMDYKFHTLIDLCVGFMLLTMYIFEEIGFSLWGLLACLGLAAVSFAIEWVWRNTYPPNWWSSVYIDDGSLVSFRRYQSTVSFFSLILKGLLIVLLAISVFIERKNKVR